MISVYSIGNENYTWNGDAILRPVSCTVQEVGGGAYQLNMSHPTDMEGRWKYIQPGALIKVPVPVATIQGGAAGLDVDIYVVTANSADLQEEPQDAWIIITYSAWNSQTAYGNAYNVGSRVTYSGNNYECISWNATSLDRVNPPSSSSWWKRIPNSRSSGVGTLAKLANGDEVYLMEETSPAWLYVMMPNGTIGYVRSASVRFDRHEKIDPAPERTVSDQLFRVINVSVDTRTHMVKVIGQHVSYDLAGILIGDCDMVRVSPSIALTRMRGAWLNEYKGKVLTNMTSAENGTITANVSWNNAIYGLLDPDKGLVSYFRGQLFRDNWDIFLMKNDRVDRGVVLSYGTNLKGLTWVKKSEDLVTRVIPIAKDDKGKDLFLPEQWVDSENINNYPVIISEKLKVNGQVGKEKSQTDSTKWTVETLCEEMRKKARERFDVDHADAISVELTVDFVLLGDTEEYKQYKGMQKLYMYDQVTVRDATVGLDLKLQVSSFEWDAINKRYNKITLGNVFDYDGRTVSAYQIGDGAIPYEKISQAAIDRIISEVQ